MRVFSKFKKGKMVEIPVLWETEDGVEYAGVLTTDINEISGFNPTVNEKGTTIRFYDGKSYWGACLYDEFKSFYESVTGRKVTSFIKSGKVIFNDLSN